MRNPPPKRDLKRLLMPSDATETGRQGQGIGDIEAMRQALTVPAKAAWQATQDAGTQQRESLNRLLSGKATQDDMSGIASDFMLPAMGSVRKVATKVAKNVAPSIDEAIRVANKDKYFPIPAYHGTTSPTGIKAFKVQPGGTAWSDIPGPHVGTLEAATQRIEAKMGSNFEAVPAWDRKTQKMIPNKLESAASILPLQMRMEKPFLDSKGKVFTEAAFGKEVEKWAKDNGYFSNTLPQGDPLKGAPFYVRMETAQKDFANKLLAEGYDAVPYVNAVEDPNSISYLVLKPNNLRSRYAKFDPKKLNSANLSAGLGSLFAGSALAKSAAQGKKSDDK